MEENDDSFIIDVSKLIEEFEKFLKSLSGAYDNLMKEKDEKPSDSEIESFFQPSFPNFDEDIKPFIDSLKAVKSSDWQSPSFLVEKDSLTIYQVMSFFLLSIYKVILISIVQDHFLRNMLCCFVC